MTTKQIHKNQETVPV